MESKDFVITVVGIMGSLIATVIFGLVVKFEITSLIFSFIGLLSLFILVIAYFFYRKIVEVEEIVIEQMNEQKRLNEKLKIHEQLVDIKKDIEILKQRTKK